MAIEVTPTLNQLRNAYKEHFKYGMFSKNLEKQQIVFLKTIAKLLKQAL